MDLNNIDRRSLTTGEVAQLDQWKATKDMLQSMNDVAAMVHEMINMMDDSGKSGQNMGQLLTNMVTLLDDIKNKDFPEQLDQSKPIIEAIKSLDKNLRSAISKLDTTPEINVNAPEVHVSAPTVNVDLKAVEKLLKTTLPNEFRSAIESMPAPQNVDNSVIIEHLLEINDTLLSIDRGVHTKPNGPGASTGTGGGGTNDGTYATPGNQATEIARLTSILSTQTDGTQKTQVTNFPTPTGLTDTQLRATPVPVSNASLPLPTGASTSAKQDIQTAQLQALNSLTPSVYDYIDLSYTGTNLTTVLFKNGGSSGTLVSTLTLAYTGTNLTSVTKT